MAEESDMVIAIFRSKLSITEALERAVRWVLAREDVFLNSSSDARLLEMILRAASEAGAGAPDDVVMLADVEAQGIEPLFVRGVSDAI